MATLIRAESAGEYFKEMVESALEHQHLKASDTTVYYLVNLLTSFAMSDRRVAGDERPLGIQLLEAFERGGSARTGLLRTVGDRSLFISGFFSDSLNRQLADVDYYVALGAYAYVSLSRESSTTAAAVFDELGRRFVSFVDVLGEVSERSALTSNHDVLRLYEKWLRTGSTRDGKLLAKRGIVPNASIGDKFVQ